MNTYQTTESTLAPKTVLAYEQCYRRHWNRVSKETGRKDLTPDEVVAELIVRKPNYSMAAWRNIKAAFLYVLETKFPDLENAASALKSQSSAGLSRRSANTSGRKIKEVPLAAWKALSATLSERAENGHKHSQGLLDVLNATLLTGLRPNEWSYSSIRTYLDGDIERKVLHIRNSKNTNGRANGPSREMFIDSLDELELKAITDALAYCKVKSEKDAERLQIALKNELDIARDMSLVGKKKPQSSVTLYSFRHQFLADAKATYEDPVLISALAGHASTKTAFEHYGKKRNSKSRIKVMPTPESVEAVQKITLEVYRQFVAERARSSSFKPWIS